MRCPRGLPQYTDIKVESADLTEVQPAEYRADLVLSLSSDKPVLGIVVEVQLSIDGSKRFTWPAYVANLRARLRCPVCLFVFCRDLRVARWAEEPILIGCTNVFVPRVLGPENVPEITDEASAVREPELTMLSAMAHGRDPDVTKVVRIAAIARGVSAKLDADRSKLYFDLVLNSLSEAALTVLRQTMNLAEYECQSELAKGYYLARGRVEMVRRLLQARFGRLTDEACAQLARSDSVELCAIIDRSVTAASLQEALAPQS